MGKFLTNGGNIPMWDFSSYGKNNPIGFFLPWDFSWDS
jgi:hypothetical protein